MGVPSTLSKQLTVVFTALQALGIAVGCVLAFLIWRQLQTVEHLQEVSWPMADTAMEMRVLFLQEKAELACAHCHEYRYGGIAALDSLRQDQLDHLRRLDPTLTPPGESRFAQLSAYNREQVKAIWPDLKLLTDHLGKLGPEFASRHGLAMARAEKTTSQLDSLMRATEARVHAEMLERSQQASAYAYAGLVGLGLLGLMMVGATWHLGRVVRRQVSDPIERMAAEVDGISLRRPGARVTVPEVAELAVLARTLNQALEGLEKAQAERRQLDRHLIQTERLAAVGVAASGIVHNLKNPLSVILGFGEILKLKHPQIPEAGYIVEASGKMSQMIEDILAKGRRSRISEPVDLNALLQRELDFLQADLVFKHEVKRELLLADPLPPIHCVYTDLSQVFANLLQNAVDAMRGQEQKRLRVRTAATPTHLEVEVADTGCGIPEAARAHLFEPFFTTKAPGSGVDGTAGTGLGLYTARQLLQTYQATIEVDSQVGGGTTFTVRIPLA
ncbi:MAG: hypothetical protein IT369_18445 [Candidatus Latescibacteria bacterium]|nr:hypothetical protein [Candidatus Latescibacterota bacterium]